MIEDFLDLSKIESGKLKLALKPCSIKPIISKVISGLKSQAKAKSLVVNVEIAKGISKIKGDEARIAQVLLNLIDNAIKYMGEKSNKQIEMGYSNSGNKHLFKISDNGVGIKNEDHERIFYAFRRVISKLTRGVPGKGLGLSTVKMILENYDGVIWVESKENSAKYS